MATQQSRPWRSVLTPERAAHSLRVAREVAARLREPHQIEAAIAASAQQTSFPRDPYWEPYGVAQGYAGLAVMCGYLDACFPGEGWDVVGHRHLRAAADAAAEVHMPAGMSAELSGLGFAAWLLSRGGTRYSKLLTAIDDTLLRQAAARAAELAAQRRGVEVGEFDLIWGLSGVGAYLLCRTREAAAANTLRAVLNGLIALSEEDEGLPCWYTPAHLLFDEETQQQYPYGNLNCGLAHGIPGPLTLMSLARLGGVNTAGLPEAIGRLADWLIRHSFEGEWGVDWPYAVPLEPRDNSGVTAHRPPDTEQGSPSPTVALRISADTQILPSRTAWCYGSPGVARSLWLAGEALDEDRYCQVALDAMAAVYRRPTEEREIDSPTFCHGVAGLLQITLRFAHDTRRPLFNEAANELVEQMCLLYEPASLLGYRSIELAGRRVDQPGLLDGAPGAALALLAAATDVEPLWDRVFLLS